MSTLSDALKAMDSLHFDEEFQQFLGPASAWEAIDKSKLDALSWIAKALPHLEERSQYLHLIGFAATEECKSIDALIAQAKGTEKEDKE